MVRVMHAFVVTVATVFLLVSIPVSASRQGRPFDGTTDLNQLCGRLNSENYDFDDQPCTTNGCEIRQQIFEATKYRELELWKNQRESDIDRVWSKDVVVYFRNATVFNGIHAWKKHIVEQFNSGFRPEFIKMLEFQLCGPNPQALILWRLGCEFYARTSVQFKIEDGRWKISQELIQRFIPDEL